MFVCSDNLKKSVDNFKTDTTLYDSIPKNLVDLRIKRFLNGKYHLGNYLYLKIN